MECWSDGFRKIEKRVIDKIHLDREVKKISINNEIPLKTTFHYPIVPLFPGLDMIYKLNGLIYDLDMI